jgi:tetratricopeptide (TPR) repeat protein
VLLVDNLSVIIDRLSDKEKWRLREWLSRSEQRPVLIAATVKFISDTANYGQALYEFLHVQELAGCDTEEAAAVLRELANVFKAPQVHRWLEADPARLAVLNRLAGGAPRTLVMLFQLLVQGMDGPIFQELDRLLDLATPLYKARFEELPDQAQRVVDALALHWDPATRQDLEQNSRIDGNAISSQLSRLAKMGVVEEVAIPGEAKTAYQIAERFFNIWYLMRASRRSRHQLRWLVEFLKAFYSADEREKLAYKLLHAQGCEPLSHGNRLLAMSQAVEDRHLQRELQNTAFYMFAKADRQQRADVDLSDIDRDWLKRLDKLEGVSEKETYIRKGIEEEPSSASRYCKLGDLFTYESQQYLKAEETYRTAIEVDPGYPWGWVGLGVLLSVHFGRYAEAEQAFRNAIESHPRLVWSWLLLGDLLTEHSARYVEAEQVYRKATKIDSKNAWAWSGLGNVLARQLRRAAEAEQAYRTAVELDPNLAKTRGALAWILFLQRKKEVEAESLARRAWELNPEPGICHTLACILAWKGKGIESLEWIRSYLGALSSELDFSQLSRLQYYFRELVHHNQADLAVRLLKESDRGQAWRPLVEALYAAGKRERGLLKRINPEQREPAEQIYDFFVAGLDEEEADKPKRGRKSISRK